MEGLIMPDYDEERGVIKMAHFYITRDIISESNPLRTATCNVHRNSGQ